MKAYIKAINYALPEGVLTNEEVAAMFPEWTVEKIEKKLGIKVCEENDPNAIKFVPKDKQKTDSLRWNNPQFTNDIRSLVSEDLSSQDFVCVGIYLPEENAVLLDMSSATPLD